MNKLHYFTRFFVALILLLVIAIGYHFDLSFHQSIYLQTLKETQQLRHSIQQANQQSKQSPQYQSEFLQAQRDFTNTIAILPNTQNFNNFLQGIVKQGQSDQLTFTTLNPQPTQAKDFYHIVSIQLTMMGTYQHLLDFMQQTAAPNSLIDWGNWTISRDTPAETTLADGNGDLLTFKTTANFYYYP